MKTMIKNILPIAILLLILQNCTTSKAFNQNEILGVWTEEWFDSDVNYLDTIKIKKENNQLVITCLSQEKYFYKNIKQQKNKVQFTLQNSVDLKDIYYINYDLVLENNKIHGNAKTNKNVDRKVEFVKIKKID